MELGIGIGWRPEIAAEVESLSGIDWVEAVAENLCADHLPDSLVRLRERGVTVVPHGVALGLGGADRPDPDRLAGLAARAELLGAPLVTEHIAFVRAGGPLTASPRLEAGHLLPVPRTWDALDVLCENVRIAQDSLPVPLALENIAALITWPGEELTEGQFLAELVERTGVRLLIDVANLHTNYVNLGQDPAKALDELPVEAIAYVHVAGGVERNGVWHDTHAHPVTAPVLEVLAELRSRVDPPGVLLERDDAFPPGAELAGELDAIRATLRQAAPSADPADGLGQAAPPADPGHGLRQAAPPADPRPVASPGTRPGTRPGPAPVSDDSAGAGAGARTAAPAPVPAGTRDRTAVAQTALLSALVAGTPAPEGFDHRRLRVQSRALAAKRADVVAKVAPELPEILGDGYRAAFLAYAGSRPMSGGYRRDALDFAEHVLIAGGPADPAARRRLTYWWQDRSGARPPRRTTRLVRAARAVLVGK
ncbi:multinuclear nonheme iron-dependent oxidase [Streptomyces anulatus]|uniref:multinuclear nonheme iron-dependent oxidase n=1 Tax=Streptomyces anulatus TaxID=1892 RepID=UPI003668B9B7